MSTATPLAPVPSSGAATTRLPGEVDNFATYLSFGLAYVLGHGAAAVSQGTAPLDLPGWLPTTLLGIGLAAGTVLATIAAIRAQRGATKPDVLSGQLLGVSWITGFAALFIAVTGLVSTLDMPDLQTMLLPTGSGLVVGLLYLAEGAARRNLLHYSLGTWLALTPDLHGGALPRYARPLLGPHHRGRRRLRHSRDPRTPPPHPYRSRPYRSGPYISRPYSSRPELRARWYGPYGPARATTKPRATDPGLSAPSWLQPRRQGCSHHGLE